MDLNADVEPPLSPWRYRWKKLDTPRGARTLARDIRKNIG